MKTTIRVVHFDETQNETVLVTAESAAVVEGAVAAPECDGKLFNLLPTTQQSLSQLQLSASKPKYQERSSPPFRPGGRGSKQLLAFEQGLHEHQSPYVISTGNPPCFGKVISNSLGNESNVLIQPMRASQLDPSLLVPWDGQLWSAKSSKLTSVEVGIVDEGSLSLGKKKMNNIYIYI